MSKARFPRCLAASAAAALAAARCGDGRPAITTPPPIVGDVTLAVAQYALYTGNQAAGPMRFPAAGAAGAQYLVVGQFATDNADLSSNATLGGSSPAAAQIIAGSPLAAAAPPAALRFHDAIRRRDEAAARASQLLAARGILPAPRSPTGPPLLGSLRTFRVCADINCESTTQVTAKVQFVGTHNAMYVDTLAPAGGFASSDLQQLGQQFDNDLYPIDVAAFGSESDIDGNGVVLILLTPKVNALVGKPDCQTSRVTGFFLGEDLAPATRASYNSGEIFYGLVPDPNGVVSCAVSVSSVLHLVAPTFIHEFQHMISFNQHVLVRNGLTEVLWLNEALSHIAEELGGRHYDSLAVDSTATRFLIGDLYNANLYLQNPGAKPMVTLTAPGTLEERGAEWLFVRYLVDQFGGTTTRQLVQTSLVGSANVVNVTQTPFAALLGKWALALYVSDLASFTPDPALTYRNWRLRTTFASLNQQDPTDFPRGFPLIPASASGGAFSVSGEVTSGSGMYVLVTQPPGSLAFTVSFAAAGGSQLPASRNAQLAVVRIE